MKKAVLTIGLFTLVLASTSFATPTISTSSITNNDTVINSIDGNGNQDAGGNKKLDYTGNEAVRTLKQLNDIDGNGNQDAGGNKKLD